MEVYMLDNRSARSPTTHALQNNGGQITFSPPPNHTLIGDIQRQWLLDELKKSTATWKFITTATAFNKTYGHTLNTVLQLPSAIAQPLAAAIIDSWSGFPMDQDSLMKVVKDEKIDGVVLMSGDTHTAAIDNGQAGGLPEIMAGCLSQTNSTLINTVPLLSFGLVWSEGGQGIGNVNTKDAFGKVSVFADDSVKLELIDEDGGLLAEYTMYSCSYQTGLTISADSTHQIRCHGDSTGGFYVSASGGLPPYRYTLDGKIYQATGLFTGLPAGAYHPAVKDSNGCTKELSIVIEQPEKLKASISKTDVSCFGFEDGEAHLTVTGGFQPYQFQWSTGDSSKGLIQLLAGVYDVTITDSNQCTWWTPVHIHQPDELKVQTSKSDVSCAGKTDGSAALSMTGGTPPYQISWSNGATVPALNTMAAGVYSFTVSDHKNCSVVDSVNINEPDSITVEAVVTPDPGGKGNGSIQLVVSGGAPPYTYLWFDNSAEDYNNGLFPGVYPVEVRDVNGCRKETSIVVPLGTAIEAGILAQLKLYPNPANDKLVIETKTTFSGPLEIKILDIAGRIVLEVEPIDFEKRLLLNITSLKDGTYLIMISNNNHQNYYKFCVLR